MTEIYRTFEDGSVLRRATPADRAELIALNGQMLGEDSRIEVEFLTSNQYPYGKLEDFLVVVTAEGKIISSMCLLQMPLRIGQTWITVAQPEFVSTLPEYQNRGFVRAMFEVIHGWLKERNLPFAQILGIRYYYRLYGYEYAIEDFRAGYLTPEQHADLVPMPAGYEVRHILPEDAPALERLWKETSDNYDIALYPLQKAWEWSAEKRQAAQNVIEDWVALKDGAAVGSARLWYARGNCALLAFTGNLEAAQALIAHGLRFPEIPQLGIGVDKNTPLGQWVRALGNVGRDTSYAWYVRINDPAEAFRQLAPEFERRLAASSFAGLTRLLSLGFYRFGINLKFEEGKIVEITSERGGQNATVSIPPDMLPKLLMGYRDTATLETIYPEYSVSSADLGLMAVLFPQLKPNTRFLI